MRIIEVKAPLGKSVIGIPVDSKMLSVRYEEKGMMFSILCDQNAEKKEMKVRSITVDHDMHEQILDETFLGAFKQGVFNYHVFYKWA